MQTFEEYLSHKKIDSAAFKKAEASRWETWHYEFKQLHPDSFTAQKLFWINQTRRKYPLQAQQEVVAKTVKRARPVMRKPPAKE